MNLQDIITDIKDRYSGSSNFTDDKIVRWINTVLDDIYEEVGDNEILSFPTVKDKPFYEETAGIDFDLIKSVLIIDPTTKATTKYVFKDLDEEAEGYCYTKVLNDYIAFLPKPTQDNLTVNIYYEIRKTDFSVSNLTETVSLGKRLVERLKLGVMHIMAMANDEIATANNFALMDNAAEKKIKQKRYEHNPRYPKMKDVKSRRTYGR